MESVEAHKAGITLFAADCWSTAAHHCAWPTASSGWWPPPLLPLPLAILSLLLQPLLLLLRRDHPSPASSRQAGYIALGVFFVSASPLRSGHRRVSGRVSAPAVPIPGALVALSSHAYSLSLLPRALSPTVSYLSLPLREVSIVGLTISHRALSPPLSLPLSIVELHWQASLAAVTAMATLADVCPHH